MTAEEISRIKEHIETHARREPASVKTTAILWKAVTELESVAGLEKENAEMREQRAEIIEAFTSASSGDDFEMAEAAREIMEILSIPCYRHGKVVSRLTEAEEHITLLEKENAELRVVIDFQTACNMDRFFQLKKLKKQLTEAKGHIHRLLGLLTEGKRSYATIDEAKAFMQEEPE